MIENGFSSFVRSLHRRFHFDDSNHVDFDDLVDVEVVSDNSCNVEHQRQNHRHDRLMNEVDVQDYH